MKKLFILIVFAFLLTGCTVKELNTSSLSKLSDTIVDKNITYTNRVGIGYNYYIPNGVSLLEVTEANEVLYADGNKYYLYIDLISYNKKLKYNYDIDKSLYLSKKITHNKKYGYLQITKVEDEYFVEMMYNYAKIEAYVREYQLEDAITDISYLLSSIKYKDSIIESLIEKKEISTKGSTFDILKPTTSSSNNYISDVEEDLTDTSNAADDYDTIDINDND